MTHVFHDKPPTMQHWTVKITKGAGAGADFFILNWCDFGTLIPSDTMWENYETDRISLGDPPDNSIMLGHIGNIILLKHMNNLDLEQSRSKSPTSTGVV